ncbi:2-phospho-L-lactate transferase [Amylibacter sp.]|nr:2-phospho-L-lactate transferase [Amylibacter sp.]
MTGKVITLSGGVGGAKLVLGLSHIVMGGDLVVACNTGDDFDHLGLRVCPDIDSILYSLSGLSDQQRGWGRRDETWTFMSALGDLKAPNWFNLGDGDLATHVFRSDLLRQGQLLGAVTAELALRLGITATICPMSDDPVATIVQTPEGELAFQHYFVREQCKPSVTGFRFEGLNTASLNGTVADALNDNPRAIIIAPSNPYVSVDPILHIPGMMDALIAADAPIVAVSPIVGGQALKGPAAKMMAELGIDVSVLGIARHYHELLDGLIIDQIDANLAPKIEAMGLKVHVTQTIMSDLKSRIDLASATLAFTNELAQ